MSNLPGFFLEHDLDVDADERTVKRVYAKQLKLIDQETDLEGFQALRDSFEEAMAWVRFQRHQIAEDVQAPDVELSAGVTGQDAVTQEKSAVEPAQAASDDANSPEAIAYQIIAAMIEDMRRHLDTPAYAGERFLQTLDDERLIHMETGLAFEQMIAQYLLQGWQPGNGELFDVAADHFGWKTDSKRLLNWGEGGHILGRALLEQAEFNKKSEAIREGQWALLMKARHESEPAHYYLSVHFPLMLRILDLYPVWAVMISSRKNIEVWYARYEAIQHDASTEKEESSLQDSRENKEIPYFRAKFTLGVFFCLFLISWIAGLGDKKPDPAVRSIPPSQNTQNQSTYRDNSYLGTVERKQEDLLLNAERLKEIGENYFSGHAGKTRNVAEAIYFWEMASEKGSADASYQLAWIYDVGNGVEKDLTQAYKWYSKAAEQGELRSQLMMGNYYYATRSGHQDLGKAAHFYELAAKKGHAGAQFMLAILYDKGLGVERNAEKALVWMQAAAEGKDANAEANLAIAYLNGEDGVRKDELKAYDFASRSAAQNNPIGQRVLAQMYERGLAKQAVDMAKAATLYAEAAAHHDQKAKDKLLQICKKKKYAGCA